MGNWLSTPGAKQRRARTSRATARDGSRLRFWHNWSWDEAELPVPFPVRDILTGRRHAAGDTLRLGPWDVLVCVEE
jgi:beta-galactosidase